MSTPIQAATGGSLRGAGDKPLSLNSRSTWQSGCLHASVDAMAEAKSGLAQIIVVGEEWTNAGPQNRVAAQPP
jgi:hypothetical protein